MCIASASWSIICCNISFFDAFFIKYVYTALGEENRYITITVSQEESLSKNYASNEEIKKSMVNGLEVTIYQYHDTYLATFFYDNYYFELKTNY